jgi:hypothetical protein
LRHGLLAGQHGGRLLAAADARCLDHAHVSAQQHRQARQQVAGAGHLAAQARADAHDERRRRGIVLQDLEVMVEAGDLEHFHRG